jgi:cardiolipin synthase
VGRVTVAGGEGDPALAGLLSATPTMGSTAAERFFAMTIAGARTTLDITNSYFAPDD